MEDVLEDSTTANGVVLNASGQPIQVTHRRVTFSAAVVGCDAPRTACNPVARGTRGNSGFLPVFPGDRIAFEYYAGFRPDGRYAWTVSPATTGDGIGMVTDSTLGQIRVVPNPFVLFSAYQNTVAEPRLLFSGLPPRGLLRIYTLSGNFVQQIAWTPDDLLGDGDLFWDLRTRAGNVVASGLYLWVLTAPSTPADPASRPVHARGKFVVIR